MLIGEFQHSLDTKGRLIVPAKFRDELGMRFIITRGLDGCLNAYSLVEWDKVERTFESLENGGRALRDFERWFFGGASECEIDKQGRIIIPQHLREYAKLEKEVVVIGNRTKMEIWDEGTLKSSPLDIEECISMVDRIPGLKI